MRGNFERGTGGKVIWRRTYFDDLLKEVGVGTYFPGFPKKTLIT